MQTAPQGRELNQTVAALRAHVQCKIRSLPQLSRRFSLSAESVATLEQHLTEELNYLGTLPESVTLNEVLNSHFDNMKKTGAMVMGGGM